MLRTPTKEERAWQIAQAARAVLYESVLLRCIMGAVSVTASDRYWHIYVAVWLRGAPERKYECVTYFPRYSLNEHAAEITLAVKLCDLRMLIEGIWADKK